VSVTAPVIGIVAGEASGDLLGSQLMQSLKERLNGVHFVGVGGPRMLSVGMDSLYPMEKLAVRGYVEVLRHLWKILQIRRGLRKYFRKNKCNLFIGVDSPEFNLRLEHDLRKIGVPTIHYVSPQLWAWRGSRIRHMAKAVSHMLVLFPFEQPIYEKAGIPATYVGHPLADVFPLESDREQAREQLKLPQHAPVIAMLPGSRQSELDYMAEVFIKTAKLIHNQKLNVHFLVPLTSRETMDTFNTALYRLEAAHLPLAVLSGHAHLAISAANGVLVSSGTATLEACLLKRPMIITYKVSTLSAMLFKRQAYLPYVGLPNVLMGRYIVPELLQEDANPENLCAALLNLIHDKTLEANLCRHFEQIHVMLRQNNAQKAAMAVTAMLTSSGAAA
jgi:lipid-A-disaccharide synthase